MSKQVRLRGGTTSQHSTFTGAEREVTVDTTKDTLVVHDGATAGGIPLAKSSEVALKANTSDVNTALALKADTTALATKADLAGDATQAFNASTVNATTVDLGDWTITQSGTDLKFAYNGTNRFSLSSSGALTVENNVTAYGSA